MISLPLNLPSNISAYQQGLFRYLLKVQVHATTFFIVFEIHDLEVISS